MGIIFPLGPYHPALSEPLAFRLRLRGERIVGVSEPAEGATGYSERGIIELTEGLPFDDALVILERACARAGQSYRLALCLAVEKLAKAQIGRPALLVRTLFAELERINAALWTLREIARAVDQRHLWVEALEQREQIFAAAQEATKERVFWGVALPGGVREGITLESIRAFAANGSTFYEGWRAAVAQNGALNHATRELSRTVEGQEPLEIALTAAHDVRRESPYDAYRMMTLDWEPLDALDSASQTVATTIARLVANMKLSVDVILTCLDEISGEPNLPRAALKLTAGEGVAAVQTPHGPARVSVTLDDAGRIVALALQTSCADVIKQVPNLLTSRMLGEAPALLAALDLCPSCAEL